MKVVVVKKADQSIGFENALVESTDEGLDDVLVNNDVVVATDEEFRDATKHCDTIMIDEETIERMKAEGINPDEIIAAVISKMGKLS